MVLTIFILFSLTWYCSQKTEQLFNDQITAISQASPAELVKVELVDYQRKLFASKAETAVSINGGKEVRLNHQIRHFVWGIEMITTLSPDSALAKNVTTNFPHDPLQLTTDFSLLGASKSRFILPQFQIEDESGNLKITGFSAGWDLNSDLTMGNFVCFLDNLQLQLADQGELNLANLRISIQITDVQEAPLGNGTLHLEKLQLIGDEKPAIEFKNLQYRGETDLTQGLFSSTAELSFPQLTLAGETLSDGRIKLTLSGIDAELLQDLQQTAGNLQQQALDQQSNPLELQLRLFGLYSELLNSGITLTLEQLFLNTANGGLSGTGSLALLKESVVKGSLFSLEAIKANFQMEIDHGAFVTGYQLFNNLQSSGDNYQNKTVLAEQAEQISGGLIQKGIFTRQAGDRFHMDFSLVDGKGRLNGKSFQLN